MWPTVNVGKSRKEKTPLNKDGVGFIGLGVMGEGFTRQLIERWHRVIGFDIDEARMEAAAKWACIADIGRAADDGIAEAE